METTQISITKNVIDPCSGLLFSHKSKTNFRVQIFFAFPLIMKQNFSFYLKLVSSHTLPFFILASIPSHKDHVPSVTLSCFTGCLSLPHLPVFPLIFFNLASGTNIYLPNQSQSQESFLIHCFELSPGIQTILKILLPKNISKLSISFIFSIIHN